MGDSEQWRSATFLARAQLHHCARLRPFGQLRPCRLCRFSKSRPCGLPWNGNSLSLAKPGYRRFAGDSPRDIDADGASGDRPRANSNPRWPSACCSFVDRRQGAPLSSELTSRLIMFSPGARHRRRYRWAPGAVGHENILVLVARQTVASCMPTTEAISFLLSGCRCAGPSVMNCFWRVDDGGHRRCVSSDSVVSRLSMNCLAWRTRRRASLAHHRVRTPPHAGRCQAAICGIQAHCQPL